MKIKSVTLTSIILLGVTYSEILSEIETHNYVHLKPFQHPSFIGESLFSEQPKSPPQNDTENPESAQKRRPLQAKSLDSTYVRDSLSNAKSFKKAFHSITSPTQRVCQSIDSCGAGRTLITLRHEFGLYYCVNCLEAHELGSFIDTWEAEHSPKDFHVSGELVYAVPNDARKVVLNRIQTKGRIVLVDRGSIPIAEKALNIQRAGGLAAIVVDSGQCGHDFNCGELGGRKIVQHHGRRLGFAAKDLYDEWQDINIPVVLVSKADGLRLKKSMDLEEITIPGFGMHLMVREENSEE